MEASKVPLNFPLDNGCTFKNYIYGECLYKGEETPFRDVFDAEPRVHKSLKYRDCYIRFYGMGLSLKDTFTLPLGTFKHELVWVDKPDSKRPGGWFDMGNELSRKDLIVSNLDKRKIKNKVG